MKKNQNEIYALVDEDFMSKFEGNHLQFMQDYYYNYYLKWCKNLNRKPLSKDLFFTNMRRRRLQFYQLCCPYCGTIVTAPHDKRIQGVGGYNYCVNCGKGSVMVNIAKHLSRFINLRSVNRIGLDELKKQYPDTDAWILAYNSNCYHAEIIMLTTIIEVLFRDYFEALMFINNLGNSDKYIRKVAKKHTANNFMRIEKANVEYKRAFDINLKEKIIEDDWNALIDVVNLRNIIVHNNARIDEQFKKTPTYQRLNSYIDSDIVKLDEDLISHYFTSVTIASALLSKIFIDNYVTSRNVVIANYYFNNNSVFDEDSVEDDID